MFSNIATAALAEIERDSATSRLDGRIARAIRAEIERGRDDRIVPAVFAEIVQAALEDEIERDPAISRVGDRIARAVRAEIERERDDRIVLAVFAEIVQAALEEAGPPKPAARRQQPNALPDPR